MASLNFVSTLSKLLVMLYASFNLVLSWIELDLKILSDLTKFSFRVKDPHYALIAHSVYIPCVSENVSVSTFTKRSNNNVTWVDFDGLPIIGDRHILKNESLFLAHVLPEDSRRIFCQINFKYKIEHYVIVYDVPHVHIEYSFLYETPICSKPLMMEKELFLENLIEHNVISIHHGLLYTVSKKTCHYTDKKAYAQAQFIISCEDRLKDFKISCQTLECYFLNTSSRLLNVSYNNAQRWREVEHAPIKYPDIVDEYDRVKEFTLSDEPMEQRFVSTCPDKFTLFNNLVCVPCMSGSYYNNITFNCSDCPINSFQPFDLMTECFACPENTETNITGAHSETQCTLMPSIGEIFIRENSKSLVVFCLITAIGFTLLWCYFQNKKKLDDEEKKKRKKLIKKVSKSKTAAEINVPGKREYYVSPKKKIIEINRADFMIQAQKNIRKNNG